MSRVSGRVKAVSHRPLEHNFIFNTVYALLNDFLTSLFDLLSSKISNLSLKKDIFTWDAMLHKILRFVFRECALIWVKAMLNILCSVESQINVSCFKDFHTLWSNSILWCSIMQLCNAKGSIKQLYTMHNTFYTATCSIMLLCTWYSIMKFYGTTHTIQ